MIPKHLDYRKILKVEDIEKFWSKVKKTSTCWLWTGKTNFGYGNFYANGVTMRVHRISFCLANGPLPKDKVTDHLCRVRNCVNPQHLEMVTSKVNNLRGISVAAINARKTHCLRGHPFVGKNIYFAKRGRYCQTCRYEAVRKKNQITKAERHERGLKRHYKKDWAEIFHKIMDKKQCFIEDSPGSGPVQKEND